MMNATEERHLSPQGFAGGRLNKSARPMSGNKSDGTRSTSPSYESHPDWQLRDLVFSGLTVPAERGHRLVSQACQSSQVGVVLNISAHPPTPYLEVERAAALVRSVAKGKVIHHADTSEDELVYSGLTHYEFVRPFPRIGYTAFIFATGQGNCWSYHNGCRSIW